MTPHKAIEVLKELKPGDRWEITLSLEACPSGTLCESWAVIRTSFYPTNRTCREGSTLDEAMEKVLESLNVPSSFGSK